MINFSMLSSWIIYISLGCSSFSENSIKREKNYGNSFCKSSYQLEGFYEDYEEQDVHMWVELDVEGMHLLTRSFKMLWTKVWPLVDIWINRIIFSNTSYFVIIFVNYLQSPFLSNSSNSETMKYVTNTYNYTIFLII